MHTKRVLLNGLFALFILASTVGAEASEYAPWTLGDYAVYQNERGNQIKATVDNNIRNYNHYTNFAGLGPLWVKTATHNEKVFIYSPVRRAWQLLMDFNAAVGTSNGIDVDPCNRGKVTLGPRGEKIETPAGTFADVVRLDFSSNCADAGVISTWFARGVGPVQWAESNIAGALTYSIVSAQIGGVAYPKPTFGVSLLGEFPDPQVWINRMPGPGPRPGPTTVPVFLTIQNNTERPLVYSFPTSQRFDILVIDANGRVVSRWSRDKLFLQAFGKLELAPGEKKRLGGSVPLSYDDGQPLAPGGYTLKIELGSHPASDTAHNPGSQAPAALAPLEIGWAF